MCQVFCFWSCFTSKVHGTISQRSMPEFLAQQLINHCFSQGYLELQEFQGKRETPVNWAWPETRDQQGRRVKRETKGTCPMMCYPPVRRWRLGPLPGWTGPEPSLGFNARATLGFLSSFALWVCGHPFCSMFQNSAFSKRRKLCTLPNVGKTRCGI